MGKLGKKDTKNHFQTSDIFVNEILLIWAKVNFNNIVIIIIILFKFKKFLNLYNPHVAMLIEAGCITYRKIHYITNIIHYIIIKFTKNISLLKSNK